MYRICQISSKRSQSSSGQIFTVFLHQTASKRKNPFSYVIRELDAVPGVAPPIMRGKSYSEDHGFVEKELITRDSHTNPHFKEHNSKVY